jgi:hypothetical protein
MPTIKVLLCCHVQESTQEDLEVVRQQLLTAETQRDTHLLHLQRLQRAVAESSDGALKEKVAEEQAAASAGLGGTGDGTGSSHAGDADVDIITSLRERIAELERDKRQLQTLQRATSSVLSRGNSAVGRSRLGSATGTAAAAAAAAGASRPGTAAGGDTGLHAVPMTPAGRMSDASDMAVGCGYVQQGCWVPCWCAQHRPPAWCSHMHACVLQQKRRKLTLHAPIAMAAAHHLLRPVPVLDTGMLSPP